MRKENGEPKIHVDSQVLLMKMQKRGAQREIETEREKEGRGGSVSEQEIG